MGAGHAGRRASGELQDPHLLHGTANASFATGESTECECGVRIGGLSARPGTYCGYHPAARLEASREMLRSSFAVSLVNWQHCGVRGSTTRSSRWSVPAVVAASARSWPFSAASLRPRK
jgi:hypothetical protein